MRSSLIALAAGVVVSACAGGSTGAGRAPAPTPAPAATTVMQQAAQAAVPEAPKPKAFDPSGMYSVSLTYGGAPLLITLQLGKGASGAYGGMITVDQVPDPIRLNTVEVTGKRVVATLSTPDGAAVTMDFTIEGENLSGTYRASSGDGSALSGKKIP